MIIAFGLMTIIPGYTAGVVQTGWALILVVAPILLFWRQIEMTAVHWLGLATLIYAGVSLSWSPHGTWAFLQLCALASVFVWIQDIRRVAIGLAAGLGVSAVLSVFQLYGIDPVYRGTMFPSGLFVNHDVFAEISATVLVLLLANRLWWWLPVCIPGLAIGSRAAIVGLTCAFLAWVWGKSKIAGAVLSVALGGLTIKAVTSFSSSTIDQRLDIYRDAWGAATIWGHGIGSYEYLAPFYSVHNQLDALLHRAYFAHNDILQLIFELGIGAVPLIIAAFMLLMVKDNNRYVLICFGVIGLFAFPLHVPIEAFMAACVAGHLGKRVKQWKPRISAISTMNYLITTP
jgi:hypothetical protein